MPNFLNPDYFHPHPMELVVVVLKDEDGNPTRGLFKMSFHHGKFIDQFCREYDPSQVIGWKSTGQFTDPYKQSKRILNRIVRKTSKPRK